jgi:hypothetical protein
VSGTLENADTVVDRTFWVGVYPGLGEAELDHIAGTFTTFCMEHGISGLRGLGSLSLGPQKIAV